MKLVKSLIAGTALLAAAATVNAGMMLEIDYGSDNTIDGYGTILNSNVIQYTGSGSGFDIDTSLGIQNANTNPLLHLNTVVFSGQNTCSTTNICAVTTTLSYDEYVLKSNAPLPTLFNAGVSATLSSGMSFEYTLTATDAANNSTILQYYAQTNTGSSTAYAYNNTTGVVLADGLYTLTAKASYLSTSSNAQSASSDADVNIPEPASLALMGLGLLGMGAAKRRRA